MKDFEPRQEEDAVPGRLLVRVAAVSLVVAAAAVAVEAAILHAKTGSTAPRSEEPAPSGTVEQTLIGVTQRGLELQKAQRKTLEETVWIDEAHGVARIPIDRAMDIVVDREGKR